ncbi:MAG: low molecular weight phosphatase family protein [Cryobacterium sp.]|nr:low molecular weight phosphatase family protein [Cryobacterium sp.]
MAEPGSTDETPFTILVVCTGNICRSPLAEQLLAARLGASGISATVASAGTRALVGYPMTAEAAALSVRYGGDPSAHAARQLTAEHVEDADLILAATRYHRGEVVTLSPKSSRSAFTLRQFARLVEPINEAPPAGGSDFESQPEASTQRAIFRRFVDHVAANRGVTSTVLRPTDDDMQDPYRRSRRVYERVGREIDAAVAIVVTALVSAREGAWPAVRDLQ